MRRRIRRKKENKIYRFFNNASNGLKLRISILRKDVVNVEKLFIKPEVQERNSKLFTKVINVVKAHPNSLANIMKNTKERIRKENADIFINAIDFLEGYPDKVYSLYGELSQEEKNDPELIGKMVNNIGENEQYLVQFWGGISPDNRKKHVNLFRKILTSSKQSSSLSYAWISGGSQIQLECEDLFPSLMEKTEYSTSMWIKSDDSIKEKYAYLLPEVLYRSYHQYRSNDIEETLKKTPERIKEKVMVDALEKDSNLLPFIMKNTDEKIVENKITDIMIRAAKLKVEKNNSKLLDYIIWNSKYSKELLIDKKISNKVSDLLESLKENPEELSCMWQSVREILGDKVQINNYEICKILIEHVYDNLEFAEDVLNGTNEKVKDDNIIDIIKIIKNDKFGLVNKVWHERDKEVQENKVAEVIKIVKDKPNLVYTVWIGTDKEAQENKIAEVIKIVKDKPNLVEKVWIGTDKEAQKAAVEKNDELLEYIIDLAKEEPSAVASIWIGTDKNIQKKNEKILIDVIKLVESNPDLVEKVWIGTDKEAQKAAVEKNDKLLEDVIEAVKDNANLVRGVWIGTDKEVQENKVAEVINIVKDKPNLVDTVWIGTDKEAQENKIAEVIKIVKDKPNLVYEVWIGTDKEAQKAAVEKNDKLLEDVIEAVKDNANLVRGVWEGIDKEVQENKVAEVIKIVKDNPESVANIWNNTDKEAQENKIAEVIKIVKENPESVKNIWIRTDKEAQENKIAEVIKIVKDKPNLVYEVWIGTDKEAQKAAVEKNDKLLEDVIEAVKDNANLVRGVWEGIDKEVQENKVAEVIKIVKDKPNLVYTVWIGTDKEAQKAAVEKNDKLLEDVIEAVKDNANLVRGVWEGIDKEVQENKVAEVIKIVKDNPESVAEIWNNTDKEVQENKVAEVIKIVKDNPESVANIWNNTDKEAQKAAVEKNDKLLEDVIEAGKDDPIYVMIVWHETDKEVQENKVVEVIKIVKDNAHSVSLVRNVWEETDIKVQKNKITEVIEIAKENPLAVATIWSSTNKEAQKAAVEKNGELLEYIIDLAKKEPSAVATIWSGTNEEVQKAALKKNPKLLESIIDLAKKEPSAVATIWSRTNKEAQKAAVEKNDELLEYIIDLAKEEPSAVATIWSGTNEEVQKAALEKNPKLLEYIIDLAKEEPSAVATIWSGTDKNIQQKNEEILIDVIKIVESNPDLVRSVWNNTDKEVQKNKIAEVIKIVKENPSALIGVWGWTDKKLQEEKIEEVIKIVKENPSALTAVWRWTDKKLQEEKIEEVIKIVKENQRAVDSIWRSTDKKLQEEKIEKVIEIAKEEPSAVATIWSNTDKEVQKVALKKNEKLFEYIIEIAKEDKLLIQYIVMNTESEIILNNFNIISEKFIEKKEIQKLYEEKIKMLYEKNNKLFATLNLEFLDKAIEEGYTDEQMLRITNYPEVQEFILQYKDNKIMNNAIKYMLENDSNWILSIERIKNNNQNYNDLLKKISINIKEEDIDDKFIQNVLLVISNRENYFNIQTVEDVKNYNNIKNNICENILNGKIENMPESLKKYPKEQQYKFALLEYKFGIDLEEAKFLINRYGTDAEKILEKMPHKLEAKYLYALKEIVESDNIEEIIEELRKNNALEKPWLGFPSARNAEGQIINMFAELYNETLYQPKEEDKNNQQETYIDKEGNENKIDVYNINGDFDMNIRVEGAYNPYWTEPENFVDYYNYPDITTHGNCESFIGNDLIASARFSRGVMVGYSIIRENNLTASGPHDLVSNTTNKEFSAYRAKSKFLTPKEMKDNTRHPHNEMVKDRIIIDENGNVARYMPNYAVWIEEDTEEERNQPGWKEEREKDEKWIMTKKLAAQLGIPIVVIDRERFAKKEMEKIELLQKLINGEEVDGEKYGEYLKEYEGMSKPELIRESIIKFENNRVGIQFNKNLHAKYFTQKQFEQMVSNIRNAIDRTEPKEQIEMLRALLDVSKKEYNQIEIGYDDDIKQEKYAMQAFYNDCISRTKLEIKNIKSKKVCEQTYDKTELLDAMQRISRTDYYEGNKQHSIEHIQKVMLFSQVLAEGEGLSEEDKKLLLVAAAFHDSGRKGLGEGRIDHAEPSAKKTGELLREENEFGKFSEEDITIIQTAIHYHEHKEKINGKLDYEEIERLSKKYAEENGIENLDIQRTAKMCELLKDADALDRYRFANRGALNPQYLHSATAKKESTIDYAREVNERVATKILKEVYGEENTQEGNAVSQLRDVRVKEKRQEPHLNFEDIYTDTPLLYALDDETEKKKNRLYALFKSKEVTKQDMEEEVSKTVFDMTKENKIEDEKEQKNIGGEE